MTKPSFQSNNSPKASLPASLTAECALILPFFFLCLLTLASFMDIYALRAELRLEASNKARLAAAGAIIGEELLPPALSLPSSTDGDTPSDPNTCLERTAVRTQTFPFSPIPLPSVTVTGRSAVYPWIGASDTYNQSHASAGSDTLVYVSETESVYHTDADCPHITVTVITADTAAITAMRNADGSRYRPAPGVPTAYAGTVYTTPTGLYYYASPDVPALTRRVRLVSLEEAEALPLCSRCAARAG